jgi:hypothetical protein
MLLTSYHLLFHQDPQNEIEYCDILIQPMNKMGTLSKWQCALTTAISPF